VPHIVEKDAAAIGGYNGSWWDTSRSLNERSLANRAPDHAELRGGGSVKVRLSHRQSFAQVEEISGKEPRAVNASLIDLAMAGVILYRP
jgi:hypothetical protein